MSAYASTPASVERPRPRFGETSKDFGSVIWAALLERVDNDHMKLETPCYVEGSASVIHPRSKELEGWQKVMLFCTLFVAIMVHQPNKWLPGWLPSSRAERALRDADLRCFLPAFRATRCRTSSHS
jgi:hypothetical protein